MKSFNDFKISAAIKSNLDRMKITIPTPIQEKSIPIIETGVDFIGCAATGTGKTLAFALPILNKIEITKKVSLILCPTRELAIQIEQVFKNLLLGNHSIKVSLIIGGIHMGKQIKSLSQNPQIIIATPGRLNDHLNHKTCNLGNVNTIVLDEADRMLDMGFAPQIDKILRVAPRNRQTILFSATFPESTKKLIDRMMKNPQKVVVGQVSKPQENVSQAIKEVSMNNKNNVLLDELNARKGSVLVFTRTKHRTDKLYKYLVEYGYSVCRIHGDRSQNQRIQAIEGFRSNKYRILVATDVASRGIDVTGVGHVINYDLPDCSEDYIHRIGRTGRAGAKGQALSLLMPQDSKQWKSISRLLQQKHR